MKATELITLATLAVLALSVSAKDFSSEELHQLVINIRMPEMNGLEVPAKLRVSSPDTRVIVMTGENDPAYREAALAGGASAFFFKPFDNRAFLASVRKAICPFGLEGSRRRRKD